MIFTTTVTTPFYDYNGRKYMKFEIPHDIKHKIDIHDVGMSCGSVDGNDIRVKVQFRYNRPVCNCIGLTPVRSMKAGDAVSIDIQFRGVWNNHGTVGNTWVLKSIEKL